MNNSWQLLIDFSYLSLLLVIANVLKSKVKWLKNFLIPTAIIAGLLGLMLGNEGFNFINFNISRLGGIVYHLMALGFISLSLKETVAKKTKSSFNGGVFIVSTYIVQGIIGFVLSLTILKIFSPNLFPAFGLLLPLGYGQGPGQAYSIGHQWEKLGFIGGGNIGLTIATFGFLWAIIIGVIFMNILIHKKLKATHYFPKNRKRPDVNNSTIEVPPNQSLDSLSVQVCLIGLVYLVTYLSLVSLSKLLLPLGSFGETLNHLIWGFHFIVGSVYAFLLKYIIKKLNINKYKVKTSPNNYLLQRISGFSFDFMITASIAAISIVALKDFIVPIIIITTIGGLATLAYVYFVGKKIFRKYTFENILGFYGMLTGTISTGMALLKEVDPSFNTDVPENFILSSAVALPFGIPLMVMLNIPIFGFVSQKPSMYWLTIALFFLYLIVLWAIMYFVNKRTAVNERSKIISADF